MENRDVLLHSTVSDDQEEFDRQYEAIKRAENEQRRQYRRELERHRAKIRRCNQLLVLECIALASVILALILRFVW